MGHVLVWRLNGEVDEKNLRIEMLTERINLGLVSLLGVP